METVYNVYGKPFMSLCIAATCCLRSCRNTYLPRWLAINVVSSLSTYPLLDIRRTRPPSVHSYEFPIRCCHTVSDDSHCRHIVRYPTKCFQYLLRIWHLMGSIVVIIVVVSVQCCFKSVIEKSKHILLGTGVK